MIISPFLADTEDLEVGLAPSLARQDLKTQDKTRSCLATPVLQDGGSNKDIHTQWPRFVAKHCSNAEGCASGDSSHWECNKCRIVGSPIPMCKPSEVEREDGRIPANHEANGGGRKCIAVGARE